MGLFTSFSQQFYRRPSSTLNRRTVRIDEPTKNSMHSFCIASTGLAAAARCCVHDSCMRSTICVSVVCVCHHGRMCTILFVWQIAASGDPSTTACVCARAWKCIHIHISIGFYSDAKHSSVICMFRRIENKCQRTTTRHGWHSVLSFNT